MDPLARSTHFPFSLILVVGLAIGVGVPEQSRSQDLVELGYKLREGDVLTYQTEVSSSLSFDKATLGGRESFVVSTTSEDGTLNILPFSSGVRLLDLQSEQSFDRYAAERARIERSSTFWGSPFFDRGLAELRLWSDSGTPVNPVHGSFQAQIRTTGELVEFSIGGFPSELAFFPMHFALIAPLGEWAQDYPVAGLQPWIQFPEEPIEVGDSWEQEMFEGVSMRHSLVGFENVQGYRCAELQSVFVPELVEGTSSSFIAVEEGFLVRTEIQITKHSLTSELISHKSFSGEELRQFSLDWAEALSSQAAPTRPDTLNESNLIGRPAPDFRLDSFSSNSVALGDFRGKVVVLNFWVSWLPVCIQLMPHFVDIVDTFDDPELAVVGITFETATEHLLGWAEAAVKRNRVEYPVLVGDGAVYRDYGLSHAVPTTFLIDREGQSCEPISAIGLERDWRRQSRQPWPHPQQSKN